MVDTVKINDIFFDLEDEELPDIEYLEILTMEEIIKNNPSFIAFSRQQIYDELYNVFKNKNKSKGFIDLFYEIIENQKKLIDTTNYIIKTDAIKNDYEDDETIDNLITTIKKLNRTQYELSQNAKNRLFFAITYDEKTEKLRFKAETKTNIELYNDDNAIVYPIYPNDDANIPIQTIYYQVPQSTINDYLNVQSTSHLLEFENINETEAKFYTTLYKLLKVVRPSIEFALDKLENDEHLDYNNINNLLKKYDKSLDFIKIKDYEKLKEHITKLLEKDKEEPVIHNNVKIKPNIKLNNKYTFFDNLEYIFKLLDISDKIKENYDAIYAKLEEDKMSINEPSLLYNNMSDIITALNTSVISLDDVSENIKLIKKSLIIEHSLNIIKFLKETDVEKIKESIEYLRERYMLVKNSINEISNFHFVDFYGEIKEIILGNDNKNYEGVPTALKTLEFEDLEEKDDVPIFEVEDEAKKENLLEKYWLSMKYKDEIGFVEILKIILPYLNKIQDLSKILINYDILCDNLFNKFRGVPSKLNLLKKYLKDTSLTENYLNDIVKLTPKAVFSLNLDIDTEINKALTNANIDYVNILLDVLYDSLAWWSLQSQSEIIDEIIILNQNQFYIPCMDKWALYGLPLEKSSKNGILSYLSCVCLNIFREDDMFIKIEDNIDKFLTKIMNIIEKEYTDTIKVLRDKYKSNDALKKKGEKGLELQRVLVESINKKSYDKLVNDYVNALLYMPGIKFKQVHKYLLGCCLQKIDSNFKSDSDLIDKRKDLLAVKNKYSKHRATIKERFLTFIPEKNINEYLEDLEDLEDEYEKDTDDISKEDIEDRDIKEYIVKNIKNRRDNFNFKIKYTNTEMITGTVEEWLNNMYDKSPLLPNNIITEFIENIKPSLAYIESYLQYLTITSKNKKSELISLFIPEKINHKNILLTISVILFKTEATDKTLINVSIETIKNILEYINTLDAIINEDNRQDIYRIKAYIIARAMCLPCNPENNIGGVLKSSIKTPINFIDDIAKNIHNSIIQLLKTNKIPTMEENIEFINSIREKNKNLTLSVMNKKTMEERNIINELKKLGIPNKVDEDIPQEGEEIEINKDIIENEDYEGEDDFKVEDEEHDFGDYLQDCGNSGFIYS